MLAYFSSKGTNSLGLADKRKTVNERVSGNERDSELNKSVKIHSLHVQFIVRNKPFNSYMETESLGVHNVRVTAKKRRVVKNSINGVQQSTHSKLIYKIGFFHRWHEIS